MAGTGTEPLPPPSWEGRGWAERWWSVLAGAARGWSADNAFKHSAAVSFCTIFSLAPVTIIAVDIAGVFLGSGAASRGFADQVRQIVGPQSANAIEATIRSVHMKHTGLFSTTAGIVVLFIGATSVFAQLQNSLNEIWGVKAQPHLNSILVVVLQRIVSFGMVLTVGFLLMVSMVLTTVLEEIFRSPRGGLSISPGAARALDLAAALAIVTALFAALFKFLPDVRLPWRAVWGSAFITALLFSAGKYLIAVYLAHSAVASVYGAAGSLVALLVWVYYSCAILFFGVEVTHSYRRLRGLPVVPARTAVLRSSHPS